LVQDRNYLDKELDVRRDRPNNNLNNSVQLFIAELKVGRFYEEVNIMRSISRHFLVYNDF